MNVMLDTKCLEILLQRLKSHFEFLYFVASTNLFTFCVLGDLYILSRISENIVSFSNQPERVCKLTEPLTDTAIRQPTFLISVKAAILWRRHQVPLRNFLNQLHCQ